MAARTFTSLVAQADWVAHWVIVAIIVAGIIGILYVVARSAGIQIPPFVITILWIVLACIVGVVAIKFLISLV